MRSFHRFRSGSNARAWLFSIRRHAVTRIPAVEQTPQGLTEGEVLGALAALPDGFQEVVLLSDVEELTYREVATVLNIPIGTSTAFELRRR